MDNTFYKYPNQFAAFYVNINVYSSLEVESYKK